MSFTDSLSSDAARTPKLRHPYRKRQHPTFRILPSHTDHSSVLRLCDDLLGYILYLSSCDDGTTCYRSGRIFVDTARYTAQVNRRWRAVALSRKRIWLGPALNWFCPPQWLDEVLRRSEPLPLDAIIPFDAAKQNPQVVLNALKHVNRIQTLELELLAYWWLFILDSKPLQQKAPLLERFSVIINQGFDRRRQCTPEPQNIFGGYAPRLQHLHIQNCSVNLNIDTYRSLHELVVDKIQFIPIYQLLDSLSHMKFLEKLHIIRPPDNQTYPEVYMPSAHVPSVHLLNLSELMISASLSACAQMMQSFVLPETCSIEIDAQDAHYDGPDLSTVLASFSSVLSNWSCVPLSGRQTLHFGSTEVGFSVEGPSEGLSHPEYPFVSLTLSWFRHPTQVDMLFALFPLLIRAFGRCLQPPDTLSILASDDIPHNLMPELSHLLTPWLHSMDDIQAVEFQSHRTFTLMETLFRGSNTNVLLPHMGDMVFFDVNFVTEKKRYWRRLLDILRFREQANFPVLQVDFVNCVGEFRGENLPGRFGTVVKINGRDCSDDDDDDDDEGEDSDYTVQALSD